MPTIIYPPSIPWNWMVQRPQHLMNQLSALGYTILYEDLGNFDKPAVHKLSPNFHLCQGVSGLTIVHSRPRILWLTVPSHINLIQQYSPDLVIYDAVDEPTDEFASWASYYPSIIQQAHIIFASSQSIYEHLSPLHAEVHLVRNGVDFHHFNSPVQKQRPHDLPAHSTTLVGYSGAIAPWLDWNLLELVCRENPTFKFIFLGALFQLSRFPLKEKNVIYLGLKHYSQLPGYLHNFDIALIPFRLTSMTKGCNPLKLYEYYACGLPVFATPLPELLPIPHVYLESDPRHFAARLSSLAKCPDSWIQARRRFAQKNDWSERAKKIAQIIGHTINN